RMIAFTGATGFIGSYLTRRFNRKKLGRVQVLVRNASAGLRSIDPDVKVISGDLLSATDCARFVSGARIIFYLAHVNAPINSDRDFANDARSNIVPVLNLIQAMRDNGSKPHVIYFSSGGAVYGRRSDAIPWSETEACRPTSSYG